MQPRRTTLVSARKSAARLARVLTALAATCAFAATAEPPGEADATVERLALPSALAAESLLLDVARAGERLVAVGVWGHVVLSDDRGATWRQAREVPVRTTLTSVHFVDASRGWAVGHDAVVLYTEDGGERWSIQHADPGLESPLLSVHVDANGHGLAVGAFSHVLETRDGGQRWAPRDPPGGADADPHLNAVFAAPGGDLWIAAEGGHVYRSVDDAASWTAVDPSYTGSFWSGLALPDGRVVVFGLRGHAFVSDDRGASWRRAATGTDKSLTGGVVLGPKRIVLVGLGGVVLSSDDGGLSFDLRTRPHRRSLTDVELGAPGTLVLFGEIGVERIPE